MLQSQLTRKGLRVEIVDSPFTTERRNFLSIIFQNSTCDLWIYLS